MAQRPAAGFRPPTREGVERARGYVRSNARGPNRNAIGDTLTGIRRGVDALGSRIAGGVRQAGVYAQRGINAFAQDVGLRPRSGRPRR